MCEWISVKERLPDRRKRLLVCVEEYFGRRVEIAKRCRISVDGHVFVEQYGREYEVTHWMLLPEPPKEE